MPPKDSAVTWAPLVTVRADWTSPVGPKPALSQPKPATCHEKALTGKTTTEAWDISSHWRKDRKAKKQTSEKERES